MATSDFNNDGYSDILWQRYLTQTNSQYQSGYSNMGAGGQWVSTDASSPVHNNYTFAGAHGDYNGDGYADVLWQDVNSRSLHIQDIHGGHGFLWTSSLGGRTVVAANHSDFTGDGSDDVLVYDRSSGQFGFVDVATDFTGGGGWNGWNALDSQNFNVWSVAGTNDFNGDGTDDILWYNNQSGETGIWDMHNGQVGRYTSLGNHGRVVATGDFTGDGAADILWGSSNSPWNGPGGGWGGVGTLTIGDMDRSIYWHMGDQTPVLSRTLHVGYLGPDWSVEEVGDYTRDGSEDILLRSTNGQVGYWDLDGGNVSRYVELYSNANLVTEEWFIS